MADTLERDAYGLAEAARFLFGALGVAPGREGFVGHPQGAVVGVTFQFDEAPREYGAQFQTTRQLKRVALYGSLRIASPSRRSPFSCFALTSACAIALWTIHGIISSEMKQTHVIALPNYALRCSLGEGDRVFMDYAAGRVALYSGKRLVSEGAGLYENERSDLELFLGTFHDPDVGRDVLLYTSDLRVVAAAIRYKHECKGLLTIPEDPLPGQFIIPFRTEGEAKAYLNTLFDLKTVETSQITKASFAEWQPL